MNTTMQNPSSSTTHANYGDGQVAERVADAVADGAHNASARTGKIANETFDHLSSAVETARQKTVPALERLGSGAESLARRSAETARIKTQQLREQAQRSSEQAVGYIRHEPVKSVLIAAALGALLGLLFSPSRRDR